MSESHLDRSLLEDRVERVVTRTGDQRSLLAGTSPPRASSCEPVRRAATFPLERRPRTARMRALGQAAQVLTLGALAYLCLFNLSVVRGSSMAPRIHDGDRILIDHFSYLFADIARGDIVVLKYPLDPSVDYIKRVIGLPGDSIKIAGGIVSVNGRELREDYVPQAYRDTQSYPETVLAKDHYYVLGDHRSSSNDSRSWGGVHRRHIYGKAVFVYWPLDKLGLVH